MSGQDAYSVHLDVHHYVEQQAARTPARIALRCGVAQLTYLELDQRANQLARHLYACGVRPGALVGVCLPRTPDLAAALLAILKVGAAYVPLDPAYPAERIAFMLEDSQAGVLLTYHTLRHRLPPSTARLVCLDEEQDALCLSDDADWKPLLCLSLSDHPSHVIYTSGSTGRPKGVVITHRGVASLIAWAHTVYTPEDLAVVLASTSVCFDLSVFEIFVTLSTGGTVVLVDTILDVLQPGVAADVTLINTVPSAMAELLRAGGLPPGVRVVNLAGEPFRYALAHELYALGVQKVFNLYGPTEDTTYSTYALLDPAGPATTRPPIGRPLPDTQLYILDERQTPVPPGAVGEIYLAGHGLAQGYWRRPDLTAERFIQVEAARLVGSGQGSIRLYKTGDMGRWRPDGQVEFLGRRDHQVKIRGYRIELGEIEAALEQHPLVQEAVVVVWEQVPSGRHQSHHVSNVEPPRRKEREGKQEKGQTHRGLFISVISVPLASSAFHQRSSGENKMMQPRRRKEREGGGVGTDELDRCLAAYVVVADAPTPVTPADLMAFLARTLPTYLWPAAITLLPAFPRTPNGKIDRQRLPRPHLSAWANHDAAVPPRNLVEEKLARIWREVLGVSQVSVTDDFFELGGNSLLAVRLMARIEQEFGQKLPLSLLLTG